MRKAVFDLRDGSRSLRVLRDYLEEREARGAAGGGTTNEAPYQPPPGNEDDVPPPPDRVEEIGDADDFRRTGDADDE
jgi:hypothetical protein